ncbi:hypothetical protein PC128_g18025 [Phytophthora cactorum]|nr:hypothetical protein PC128_g18025 [Phytophthora cactorum]
MADAWSTAKTKMLRRDAQLPRVPHYPARLDRVLLPEPSSADLFGDSSRVICLEPKESLKDALLLALFLTLPQGVSISRKRDVRTKPERVEDNSMMAESSS